MYDITFDCVDDTNWHYQTSVFSETGKTLERRLGMEQLRIGTDAGWQSAALEEYVRRGYPSNALEVVEQFAEALDGFGDAGKKRLAPLHRDVNDAMASFECAWRMFEGEFFRFDDQFLAALVDRSQEALKDAGFVGAYDELHEARQDATAKRTKDAILKANKSVESSLKTILGTHSGEAADLVRAFREQGFMDGLPDACAKAICKGTLLGLAVLRNGVAGHGQGAEVMDVPPSYATLAVHLAATLNVFFVEEYLRKQHAEPITEEKPAAASTVVQDDDVPF